jgi:NAD(P)-dependent dehydrogenase (short-subunit alcohol dehydrogenase family)
LAAEAIQQIVNECGRLDVLIHIAGPGAFGPIEHSDRDRVAQLYGTYMLSIQRLNLAALQAFADQGHGLVIWAVGSQIGEGAQQHLGPYLAAKGALDALASSYAAGLGEHNVETTILLPGTLDTVRDIVEVVQMPAGTRPLLVHPDGNQIGKEPARGSRVRPRSSDCRNMQFSGLFLSPNLKAIDIYS